MLPKLGAECFDIGLNKGLLLLVFAPNLNILILLLLFIFIGVENSDHRTGVCM